MKLLKKLLCLQLYPRSVRVYSVGMAVNHGTMIEKSFNVANTSDLKFGM